MKIGWMHELDGLEEGLPVGDLVRDSREDLLERQRLFVQLLERLLCAARLVLCICKGRKEGRKEKVQWISGVTTRNSFWSLAAPRRAAPGCPVGGQANCATDWGQRPRLIMRGQEQELAILQGSAKVRFLCCVGRGSEFTQPCNRTLAEPLAKSNFRPEEKCLQLFLARCESQATFWVNIDSTQQRGANCRP